jgi:hypothetical protein
VLTISWLVLSNPKLMLHVTQLSLRLSRFILKQMRFILKQTRCALIKTRYMLSHQRNALITIRQVISNNRLFSSPSLRKFIVLSVSYTNRLAFHLCSNPLNALPAQTPIIFCSNIILHLFGDAYFHAPAILVSGAGKRFPAPGAFF